MDQRDELYGNDMPIGSWMMLYNLLTYPDIGYHCSMVTLIGIEDYFYTTNLGLNLWDYSQKKFLTNHMADQWLRIIPG